MNENAGHRWSLRMYGKRNLILFGELEEVAARLLSRPGNKNFGKSCNLGLCLGDLLLELLCWIGLLKILNRNPHLDLMDMTNTLLS